MANPKLDKDFDDLVRRLHEYKRELEDEGDDWIEEIREITEEEDDDEF